MNFVLLFSCSTTKAFFELFIKIASFLMFVGLVA